MNPEAKLVEFVIENDLIPLEIRWKVCAAGVGRLFSGMLNLMNDGASKELTKMMYEWGMADANQIIHELKAGNDLHGCALAVIAMNQVFGIKSHIKSESTQEVVIHATQCMWKDLAGWTPKACSSISAYDSGLVDGMNKAIGHSFTKRRSMGDSVCELVLRNSNTSR
jgi:hypothetical protein